VAVVSRSEDHRSPDSPDPTRRHTLRLDLWDCCIEIAKTKEIEELDQINRGQLKVTNFRPELTFKLTHPTP